MSRPGPNEVTHTTHRDDGAHRSLLCSASRTFFFRLAAHLLGVGICLDLTQTVAHRNEIVQEARRLSGRR